MERKLGVLFHCFFKGPAGPFLYIRYTSEMKFNVFVIASEAKQSGQIQSGISNHSKKPSQQVK